MHTTHYQHYRVEKHLNNHAVVLLAHVCMDVHAVRLTRPKGDLPRLRRNSTLAYRSIERHCHDAGRHDAAAAACPVTPPSPSSGGEPKVMNAFLIVRATRHARTSRRDLRSDSTGQLQLMVPAWTFEGIEWTRLTVCESILRLRLLWMRLALRMLQALLFDAMGEGSSLRIDR
jgi:hypothetical protein